MFIVIKSDTSARKIAMFKNGHLRLLMSLVGFQHVGDHDDPEAPWILPAALSAGQLKQSLDVIKASEFSPPVFDDGQEAGDFIRRKSASTTARKKAVFDDEDGLDDDDDDDAELLFPAGGPTAMKKSDALGALKKKRRLRRKEGSQSADEGPTDEQLRARAEERRQKELEKNRKIKSDLMVHSSDDEPDAERDKAFFAQEEQRQKSKIAIMKELLGVGKAKDISKSKKGYVRVSNPLSDGSSDDEDRPVTNRRKRQSSAISIGSDDDAPQTNGRSSSPAGSDEETEDTLMSSPHVRESQAKRQKVVSDNETQSAILPSKSKNEIMNEDEDDDEDEVPVARPPRQRVRAGFIVDSSDEE